MKGIYTITKSTNEYNIYDQFNPRVAHGRKGALEEAGRAEQHIITKAALNVLTLGGGA